MLLLKRVPLIQALAVVLVLVEEVVAGALELDHQEVWLMSPECSKCHVPGLVVHEVLAVDQVKGLERVELVLVC